MSATNGAMMTTENSVELSAMICTPRTFMMVKAAMIAQQTT